MTIDDERTGETTASMSPAHVWSPITDLTSDDLAARSDELTPLSAVWLEARQGLSGDLAVKGFNDRLQREWAIETGILERIYSLDRGITQLLIERGIDASLIPNDATDRPPELVATMIRDQESAVDFLFDLVAQRRDLSLSFIKEMHALMTRHQTTTVGVDQFGRELEIPLEHGAFKTWPNNPTRADGSLHQYCPPEQVEGEMERLLEMHARHMRDGVPPEVESAWLHHRFTQIHPFQDGNGRIARALASLVFIRNSWFPLVITRDDRAQYLDSLEQADENGLSSLILLFSSRQKRAFVGALGIAREVTQEGQRLDQQVAAIADLFARHDRELSADLDKAKTIARSMWLQGKARLEDLASRLEVSMSSPGKDRRAFVDSASDHDRDRSKWHRWQILHSARELGYFAGLRDFSCWTRLCLETESGRSEILLALHEVGQEYRGLVGCTLTFYRRQETAEGDRHAVDVQAVSDEIFQINYKDTEAAVSQRFQHWLDRGLVRALDTWSRGE